MARDEPTLIKVMVLGDSGVGKTTLVRRFAKGSAANGLPAPRPTVSVDATSVSFSSASGPARAQFVDGSGRPDLARIAQTHWRLAHAALVLFDVGNRDSFANAQTWADSFLARAGGGPLDPAVMIVANGADRSSDERQVPTDDAQMFAASHGFLFSEVSALTGMNVDDAVSVLLADACHAVAAARSGRRHSHKPTQQQCDLHDDADDAASVASAARSSGAATSSHPPSIVLESAAPSSPLRAASEASSGSASSSARSIVSIAFDSISGLVAGAAASFGSQTISDDLRQSHTLKYNASIPPPSTNGRADQLSDASDSERSVIDDAVETIDLIVESFSELAIPEPAVTSGRRHRRTHSHSRTDSLMSLPALPSADASRTAQNFLAVPSFPRRTSSRRGRSLSPCRTGSVDGALEQTQTEMDECSKQPAAIQLSVVDPNAQMLSVPASIPRRSASMRRSARNNSDAEEFPSAEELPSADQKEFPEPSRLQALVHPNKLAEQPHEPFEHAYATPTSDVPAALEPPSAPGFPEMPSEKEPILCPRPASDDLTAILF